MKSNEPAFPQGPQWGTGQATPEGLSVRLYVATEIAAGLISNPVTAREIARQSLRNADVARMALNLADAIIAAGEQS